MKRRHLVLNERNVRIKGRGGIGAGMAPEEPAW